MKKSLLYISIFFLLNSNAQLNQIPDNAEAVFSVNLASLSKKIELKNLKNYKSLVPKETFYSANISELIKTVMSDPIGNGIDKDGKLDFYTVKDSFKRSVYVWQLKDLKKFSTAILNYHKRIEVKDSAGIKIINKGNNFQYYDAINRIGILANKKHAYIITGPYEYFSEYDYDLNREYNHTMDSLRAIIDSIRIAKGIIPYEDSTIDENNNGIPEYMDTTKALNMDSAIKKVDEIKNNETTIESVKEATKYTKDSEYSNDYPSYYDADSLIINFKREWNKKMELRKKQFWSNQIKRYTFHLEKIANKLYAPLQLQELNSTALNADYFYYQSVSNIFKETVRKMGSYYDYDSLGNYNKKQVEIDYYQTPIGKFVGDFYTFGTGNFDNGNLKLYTKTHMSDSVKMLMGKITNNKIDADLLDIIKVENPPLLAVSNNNTGGFMKIYSTYFDKISATMTYIENKKNKKRILGSTEQIGFAFFDFFSKLINTDIIEKTFDGNIVFAITNVTKIRKKYYTYEYDEEGNSKQVEQYREQDMPVFVGGLKLGNEKYFPHLMESFVKYGLVNLKNNVYTIPKLENDFPLYLVLHGNKLIITNDSMYTYKSVLNKESKLNENIRKSVENNYTYMYWGSGPTMNILRGMGLTQFGNKFIDNFEIISQYVERMEIRSPNNSSGDFNSEFILTLHNKNKNSLVEILDMLDVLK